MATRKKRWKLELVKNLNKANTVSEKIIQSMEEVFETVIKPEPVVKEVAEPEPVVEEVATKPAPRPRKRYSRTKKTTGV